MRYLKKHNEDKIHVWTTELAKREDMIEHFMEEKAPLQPEENKEPVAVGDYSLKRGFGGKYQILDKDGIAVSELMLKDEAEIQMTELNK